MSLFEVQDQTPVPFYGSVLVLFWFCFGSDSRAERREAIEPALTIGLHTSTLCAHPVLTLWALGLGYE